jgi:hypothetical protein
VAVATQAAPHVQATTQSYGENTQAWANYTYEQAAWQQHQGVYLVYSQERLDSAVVVEFLLLWVVLTVLWMENMQGQRFL